MCQDLTTTECHHCASDAQGAPGEADWDGCKVFTDIAHALARGYTELYYVNICTGEFIEYHTDGQLGVLNEARRGADFFEECRHRAQHSVHEGDREAFVAVMNRVFLNDALNHDEVFEFTYRMVRDEAPIYVTMTATRRETTTSGPPAR